MLDFLNIIVQYLKLNSNYKPLFHNSSTYMKWKLYHCHRERGLKCFDLKCYTTFHGKWTDKIKAQFYIVWQNDGEESIVKSCNHLCPSLKCLWYFLERTWNCITCLFVVSLGLVWFVWFQTIQE